MTPQTCTSDEQHPLVVATEHYRLQFSTTGKLTSFLDAQGEERLDTGDPGKAFYSLLNMHDEIPLCEVECARCIDPLVNLQA